MRQVLSTAHLFGAERRNGSLDTCQPAGAAAAGPAIERTMSPAGRSSWMRATPVPAHTTRPLVSSVATACR